MLPQLPFYLLFYPHQRRLFHCFLEREEGTEDGTERGIACLPFSHLCVWTRDQTCSLAMCCDQELNLQTFGYRTTLQPAEPHWPVLYLFLFAFPSLHFWSEGVFWSKVSLLEAVYSCVILKIDHLHFVILKISLYIQIQTRRRNYL